MHSGDRTLDSSSRDADRLNNGRAICRYIRGVTTMSDFDVVGNEGLRWRFVEPRVIEVISDNPNLTKEMRLQNEK